MSDDIDLIRAKQAGRRARALGVTGTVSSIAVGIIVQLFQVTRADAEKAELTMAAAELRAEIAAMRSDIRGVSERVTRTETKLDMLMARPEVKK